MDGTVTLALTSDGGTGAHSIDGFGTQALAPATIDLPATIDNYATAELVKMAGAPALVQNGDAYSLDLGQAFVHTGLVRTQRAAALQHQTDFIVLRQLDLMRLLQLIAPT